jgi:hypothetical protein
MYGTGPENTNPIKFVLPRNESRHWGSVVIYPAHAHFAFQKKSEKIYILARKHIITNFGWVIKAVFLALLPFFILIFLKLYFYDLFSLVTNGEVFAQFTFNGFTLAAIILMYYSFIATYVWSNSITWFYNVYLVTNERLIHTEFKLMTGTRIIEAPLENIVDITQETYGFFPSIFGYGNVKVQTATAMRSRFDFRQVADPSWFRSTLYELIRIDEEGEP